MPDHRYRIGQMVALTPEAEAPSEPHAGRAYKIIQLLPAAWGGTRYRVKSVVEEADRIVAETSLIAGICISRDVWDRMFARASGTPDPDAPAVAGARPVADIHIRLDSAHRWAIDTGTDRPVPATFSQRDCAEAYGRALAHSRRVEMIVHDASGETRHRRASLTYASSLD